MKIAVPVKESFEIDEHFGHCAFYNVYTLTDKKEIATVETIDSSDGCGCKSDIADVLANAGVTTMLAGGIGNGAINVLNRFGISVIRGCQGKAQTIVEDYLAGKIADSGYSCASHDAHSAEGHVCSH